jgi:hypothetical protein
MEAKGVMGWCEGGKEICVLMVVWWLKRLGVDGGLEWCE